MQNILHWKKMIFPDLLDKMANRYEILYTISLYEPVGRRLLVEKLQFPERLIRNELVYLQQYGLIQTTTKGVMITADGKEVLIELRTFIYEIKGLAQLEEQMRDFLGVNEVIIVPGNSDHMEVVKQEIGKACVQYLHEWIRNDVSIAVTGGTTLAAVAEAMVPFDNYQCVFLPARGGVGEKVENQANMIVAKMAEKEKGTYKLLHVPDPLSETLYETFLNEPSVQNTLHLIKNAHVVLHGIGDAWTMANRRQTDEKTLQKLEKENAISEAFGYYFDEQGNIVHKVKTIGLQLEDLTKEKHVISIAGGKKKAKAIYSFLKQKQSDVLITDEAAANEIIQQYKGQY